MRRSIILLLAGPAILLLQGVSAYGHNCGHHGGCVSSSTRDHGCSGCGTSMAGDRRSNQRLNQYPAQPRSMPAKTHARKGKIAEVIYLPGTTPEDAMVELRLADETGPVVVRLGPAGFLKQQQLNLREGDAITVTGYYVSAESGDLLVATELTKLGRTVRFRDGIGRPAW